MFIRASFEGDIHVFFEITEGVFGFVSGLDPARRSGWDFVAGKIGSGAATGGVYSFYFNGVVAVIGKDEFECCWRSGGNPSFKGVGGFVPCNTV